MDCSDCFNVSTKTKLQETTQKMADVVIKRKKNRGTPVVVEFVDPALEDRRLRERKKVGLFYRRHYKKYLN